MFYFEVFHSWRYLAMSSHLVWLQSQHVFMIIFTMLIIYKLVFCPLQHSLIVMSSCWIFWTKWMWSDPNLSMLSISNSICPNHMHSIETVECLLCILVSRRHKDKHQVLLNDSSLLLKSEEAGTTIRQTWWAWKRGTTLSMLHACHMSHWCEQAGAPA